MTELRDIGASRKPGLVMRYPLAELSDLPVERRLNPISFRHNQAERFERVGQVSLYRVMRMNYGKPPEIDIIPKHKGLIECGLRRITLVRSGEGKFVVMDSTEWTEEQRRALKKVEKMEGTSVGWRYIVRSTSGNFIKVGSKEKDCSAYLCHVVIPKSDQPSETAVEEGRRFVDDLLKEISVHGKRLFDPKIEFKGGEGVRLYLLHNVYLYHYGSAELLLELSEDLENDLLTELLRYDPKTDDRHDPEKMDYLQKYEVGVGMYYCSCCAYYFMAFEGFVNLIFIPEG